MRAVSRFTIVWGALAFCGLLSACGGGGGSGDDVSGGGDAGSSSTASGGSGNSSLTGTWTTSAQVSSDSCNQRISGVTQTFVFGGGTVDTGIVTIAANDADGATSFTFDDGTGGCQRTYTGQFSNVSGGSANVSFSVHSVCGTAICESDWTGTATQVSSADEIVDGDASVEKVNGEACNPNVPEEVGYRPSLFECNGNAAVLMRGNLRNNFSVVLRALGGANDRDPNNPSCGTNECSPYKTQRKLELADAQVNCLGGSGFSALIGRATRISVKFVGTVTDPTDTHQFEQYCLPAKESPLH